MITYEEVRQQLNRMSHEDLAQPAIVFCPNTGEFLALSRDCLFIGEVREDTCRRRPEELVKAASY